MFSPLLRTLAFWGTFYGTYHYARQDENTQQYVYPSYAILKKKVISDTWEKGFDGDRFSDSFEQYRKELWLELKSVWNWSSITIKDAFFCMITFHSAIFVWSIAGISLSLFVGNPEGFLEVDKANLLPMIFHTCRCLTVFIGFKGHQRKSQFWKANSRIGKDIENCRFSIFDQSGWFANELTFTLRFVCFGQVLRKMFTFTSSFVYGFAVLHDVSKFVSKSWVFLVKSKFEKSFSTPNIIDE